MASRLRENRRANICGDAVWSTTRSSGRCALRRCPIRSHMRRICFSSVRALDTGECTGIPRVLARALSQICRKCCLTRVGDCEMYVKWQAVWRGGGQARPGEALNKVIKPQAGFGLGCRAVRAGQFISQFANLQRPEKCSQLKCNQALEIPFNVQPM